MPSSNSHRDQVPYIDILSEAMEENSFPEAARRLGVNLNSNVEKLTGDAGPLTQMLYETSNDPLFRATLLEMIIDGQKNLEQDS